MVVWLERAVQCHRPLWGYLRADDHCLGFNRVQSSAADPDEGPGGTDADPTRRVFCQLPWVDLDTAGLLACGAVPARAAAPAA